MSTRRATQVCLLLIDRERLVYKHQQHYFFVKAITAAHM